MFRNFWASIVADGGVPAATGSDDKGGIAIEVLRQSEVGGMETALEIIGRREDDQLVLEVKVDGAVVYHEKTNVSEQARRGAGAHT